VRFISDNTLHGGLVTKFSEAFFAKYMDHGTEMAMRRRRHTLRRRSLPSRLADALLTLIWWLTRPAERKTVRMRFETMESRRGPCGAV
jgi:hypothetical protein